MKSFRWLIFLYFYSTSLYATQEFWVEATSKDIEKSATLSESTTLESTYKRASNLELSSHLSNINNFSVFQSGGVGKQTSFFLRGADSSFQSLYLNDVEIEDPLNLNRSVQLENFPSGLADRTKVLKGPQPILHSGRSLGGAIALETQVQNKTYADIGVGENNTKSLDLSHGKKAETHSYIFKASSLSTDGISAANDEKTPFAESDDFSRSSIYLEGELGEEKKLSVKSFYLKNNTAGGIDSFGPIDNKSPRSTSRYELLSVQLKKKTQDNRHKIKLFLNHKESFRDSNGSRFHGESYQAQIKSFSIQTENIFLFAGGSFSKEKPISNSQGLSSSLDSADLYLNSIIKIQNAHLEIGAKEKFVDSIDNDLLFHSRIRYLLEPIKTELYLSYSENNFTPSLYQLYDKTYGDTDLKPTTTQSYEIGFNIMKKTKLHFFMQNYDNMILFGSSYYNSAEPTQIKGAEIENILALSQNFIFKNSFTSLRAIKKTCGQYLERRPQISLSNELIYQDDRYYQSLRHQYIGERNDSGRLPSYSLFSLDYQYQYSKSFSFGATLENFLNKKYEQVRGFGTYGRTAYLKMRASI
ncbi:MAG: TonB-dependent receptor domain-containing protein [Bacteriovoracaceae bacterium]